MNKLFLAPLSFLLLFVISCEDSDPVDNKLSIPDTYAFDRNGSNTVSYSGQIARLDMLEEMKSYLLLADGGQQIEASKLNDMFQNQNNAYSTDALNNAGKQIKSKTFAPDLDAKYYENAFDAVAAASIVGANGTQAANGQAGLITRSNGNTILVDENGKEFTQIIEKGLMGSLMIHQIFNVYLTNERIGDNVENDATEQGANYTTMEHHWDEAFGYVGVPTDFPANTNGIRFWGKYSHGRDALIATDAKIMDAFIMGRTAIVNKEYTQRDIQKEIIYEQLELVAAATAMHYLNDALTAFNNGETGDAFHVLSEAWEFTRALRLSPQKRISLDDIDAILYDHLGDNFWDTSASGINNAKAVLVNAFPELAPVQDQL